MVPGLDRILKDGILTLLLLSSNMTLLIMYADNSLGRLYVVEIFLRTLKGAVEHSIN
jgi:hypothetical protein